MTKGRGLIASDRRSRGAEINQVVQHFADHRWKRLRAEIAPRVALAILVLLACAAITAEPASAAPPQGNDGPCVQAQLSIGTPASLIACGPMLLRVPGGWEPGGYFGTLSMNPGYAGPLAMTVTAANVPGRHFPSFAALYAYVASHATALGGGVLAHTHLKAGPAVELTRTYKQTFTRTGATQTNISHHYWLLYDGVAYTLHEVGALAYARTYHATLTRIANEVMFDPNDFTAAYSILYNSQWYRRVGQGQNQRTIQVFAPYFNTALNQWSIGIAVIASKTGEVDIRGVQFVSANNPATRALKVEPVAQYTSFAFNGFRKGPISVEVPPRYSWDATVYASMNGTRLYGSLRIEYSDANRTGTLTFPLLRKATGTCLRQIVTVC